MRIVVLSLTVVVSLAAWARAAPPSEVEMAARIDALLAEAWTREGVQPAPPADDAEFLRRAWLDLCGTIPPLNDDDALCGINGFLESTAADKRPRLVQRLLARPSHATHFANVWKNVLLPQDADVQRLLRQLAAANVGLVSFADKEPTLEDVFMMVTKGLVT